MNDGTEQSGSNVDEDDQWLPYRFFVFVGTPPIDSSAQADGFFKPLGLQPVAPSTRRVCAPVSVFLVWMLTEDSSIDDC